MIRKQNIISWAFWTSRPIGWVASLFIVIGFLNIPNRDSLNQIGILFWLQVFSFTFPFNFVFYGINDWFDRESDKQNQRKLQSPYFGAIAYKNPKPLIFISIFCLVFGISISLLTFNLYNISLVLLCVFLGIFYSTPPIRLKTKLFLDTLTNGLGYIIIPFHIGYTFDGVFRFSQSIAAMSLTALALHLGGAYLDIESDEKAGYKTTASILGKKPTLFLIATLFIVSALFYNRLWFYFFNGLILFTSLPVIFSNNPKNKHIVVCLIAFYLVIFVFWRFITIFF